MAPGRPFTRDTTICRGHGGSDWVWKQQGPTTPQDQQGCAPHLAVLQRHYSGVLCGADDIVILRDAL